MVAREKKAVAAKGALLIANLQSVQKF